MALISKSPVVASAAACMMLATPALSHDLPRHHKHQRYGLTVSSAVIYRDYGNGIYFLLSGNETPGTTGDVYTPPKAKILDVESQAGDACSYEAGVCIIRGN